MLRLTELTLPLDHPAEALQAAVLHKLGIPASDLIDCVIFKRAADTRKRGAARLIYTLDISTPRAAELLARFAADPHVSRSPNTTYQHVLPTMGDAGAGSTTTKRPSPATRPIIIGFGPCGIFAALVLAQMGLCPIVLERGKAVRERTKDTWGFWRQRLLNPESNVQFGEGGAGTFSDGKLYSQVKDSKHYGRKVLSEFVAAGAPPEILYVNKPHIGTFKLVTMVERMRASIEALGGEIRFNQQVTDLLIEQGRVCGVTLANGEQLHSHHVVLAPGHSARDTFSMVHARGVYVEAKAFSIGFRIEHPQSLIDTCRYGPLAGHPILGAADYKLVHHANNGRSVYSFCMCPGGTVVAAASEPGHVVTNGMSQYSRNERNANSAIVVGITPADYPDGPLAGIAFQRALEAHAYVLGGSNYNAPGQLVGDFLAGKTSTVFGSVEPSCQPGVQPSDLATALPTWAIAAIREALPAFDKKIRGFAMHDALLTGVETRTSSPIRIKRHDDTFQSINTRGLYPAGEGAGYAGGILSAAIDGIKVAEAVALDMVDQPVTAAAVLR